MLILASNSPRRKELLSYGGWRFKVMAAEIDEQPLPQEEPRAYVLRMAETKAKAVARHAPEDAVIIAADTTVVDTCPDGSLEILGKPANVDEAEQMLRRLRGRTHQVMTGVAVLRASDGMMATDVCITDVPMRNYSDEEMHAYIETDDPMDKAGAYAIQHPGFRPVDELHGCYANVVGLPLCHVTRLLREFDVFPEKEVAEVCQQFLGRSCPMYQEVQEKEIESPRLVSFESVE